MRSIKEVLFENALYCKDNARKWKDSHGEWDNPVYDMYEQRYAVLLQVITESGLLPDWDEHLKTVRILRDEAKQMGLAE